ncbi:MAG: TIGR01458 family HAD-type hydrolase [Opitutales bacterium]|nr:TIGR01458 family HAD-type hydrolase [Opitutales bacterium]
MPRPKGLLLDLDGVFYIGNRLLPGARETLEWIRGQNVPCRFLTNTSTKNSQELVAKLGNLGLKVETEEILSAVSATKAYLENQGRPRPRVELLTRESAREEFAEFPPTEKGEADFVVIGDIGAAWSYELMNRVFRLLMNGAQLIAMHRNRFWEDEDGLRMDIGAFVAGLEYVTGQEAVIIGKPSRDFFQLALPQLDCEAADAVMVGDDIQSDIGGAKAQGLQACLVRTGKFRQDLLEDSEVQPDALLDSIADLPGWWEKQGE